MKPGMEIRHKFRLFVAILIYCFVIIYFFWYPFVFKPIFWDLPITWFPEYEVRQIYLLILFLIIFRFAISLVEHFKKKNEEKKLLLFLDFYRGSESENIDKNYSKIGG